MPAATALEASLELLLHIVRPCPALPSQEFDERRVVVLRDEAVEQCLLGPVAPVGGGPFLVRRATPPRPEPGSASLQGRGSTNALSHLLGCSPTKRLGRSEETRNPY